MYIEVTFHPSYSKNSKVLFRRVCGRVGVRQCSVMEKVPKFNRRIALFSSAPVLSLTNYVALEE